MTQYFKCNDQANISSYILGFHVKVHVMDSQNESKSFKRLKGNVVQFCNVTTLHGYHYLTDSKFTISKLLWTILIIFMSGLALGVLIIHTDDYLNSGLSTTIDTTVSLAKVSLDLRIKHSYFVEY